MYIAAPSREERPEILREAMRDIQFAALVIAGTDGLTASHIPLLVRQADDGGLALEGHVARPIDLWRQALSGRPALAIFQGPQAYVHPGWYPSKQVDGRAVPTWNYIAVHAHGTLEAVEDEVWLRRHLTELTARNEADRDAPWAITDAPADYVAGMLRAIVGLRLSVERVDGNWKMAQRHPLENRRGVIEGLSTSSNPRDHEVAAVMRALDGG
ncbi:MAG: FMN-binding negative transcriptional regulator [Phenylobacterium sp.]|uniref:FMN-binding negative transcriptional regulator n=1 Tax=Phenylobacterium sp. TaxID=1871053 RepID=UPI002737400A|nr:FMN-binding negative transcriptional regulator [Phenylobacterium sp.]MDP3176178.1 FMN-binding negative transcriptional regulator [Phenylobacterium sp.]